MEQVQIQLTNLLGKKGGEDREDGGEEVVIYIQREQGRKNAKWKSK